MINSSPPPAAAGSEDARRRRHCPRGPARRDRGGGHRDRDRGRAVVCVLFAGVPARGAPADAKSRCNGDRDGMEPDHSAGEAVAARIERRWATLSIAIVGLLVGHGRVRRHPPGHHAARPCRDRRSQDAASVGRVRRKQSRQRDRARRLGDGARDRAAIFLHAAMHAWCRRTRRSPSAPPAPTWSMGF